MHIIVAPTMERPSGWWASGVFLLLELQAMAEGQASVCPSYTWYHVVWQHVGLWESTVSLCHVVAHVAWYSCRQDSQCLPLPCCMEWWQAGPLASHYLVIRLFVCVG